MDELTTDNSHRGEPLLNGLAALKERSGKRPCGTIGGGLQAPDRLTVRLERLGARVRLGTDVHQYRARRGLRLNEARLLYRIPHDDLNGQQLPGNADRVALARLRNTGTHRVGARQPSGQCGCRRVVGPVGGRSISSA